jgi:hypothetical protein
MQRVDLKGRTSCGGNDSVQEHGKVASTVRYNSGEEGADSAPEAVKTPNVVHLRIFRAILPKGVSKGRDDVETVLVPLLTTTEDSDYIYGCGCKCYKHAVCNINANNKY